MGLVLRQLSAIVYFEGAGYRGEGGERANVLHSARSNLT